MDVDFVDEFVEVVLMASTQVDEGLDGLIWVCGDVLALSSGYDRDGVVGEGGEISHGGVDVCGFVDTDEGFIEYSEEVAEEMECYRLFGVS